MFVTEAIGLRKGHSSLGACSACFTSCFCGPYFGFRDLDPFIARADCAFVDPFQHNPEGLTSRFVDHFLPS